MTPERIAKLRAEHEKWPDSFNCPGCLPAFSTRPSEQSQILDLAQSAATLRAALEKVDDIRNRIIGSQNIDWSRDIYQLVAALAEAGLHGLGYEKANEHWLAEMAAGRAKQPHLHYRIQPFTHDRWAALETKEAK